LVGAVGQALEASFAVRVGADLEIELVEAHESVGDVDLDIGGIDGRSGRIGDGEFRRARADAPVDDGNGFRVDGPRGERSRGEGKNCEGEQGRKCGSESVRNWHT